MQLLEGEAVHDILHAWGTNGITTHIWLALAPAVEWSQCAMAFDTFDAAFDFSEHIADAADWTKRLVTTFEWPIPSFFAPVKQCREGKALISFMIAREQFAAFEAAAARRAEKSPIPDHTSVCAPGRCFPITPGIIRRCGPSSTMQPTRTCSARLIPTECATRCASSGNDTATRCSSTWSSGKMRWAV